MSSGSHSSFSSLQVLVARFTTVLVDDSPSFADKIVCEGLDAQVEIIPANPGGGGGARLFPPSANLITVSYTTSAGIEILVVRTS